MSEISLDLSRESSNQFEKNDEFKSDPQQELEGVPSVVRIEGEGVGKKRKKFRYYENYITKVLKKISPNSEITLSARQQLNNFIINLSKKIANVAIDLTEISKKKTLSHREVKNAVRITMPGDLNSQCLGMAEECLNNYRSTRLSSSRTDSSDRKKVESETQPDGPDLKDQDPPRGGLSGGGGIQSSGEFIQNQSSSGCSRGARAGILFPPSISEKFLRRWGNSNIMVTSSAPIYLASVVEYITTEILEDSNLTTISENRVRITVRDMELAVRRHTTLKDLFVKNNFEFLGGGVVPFIHPNIKYDKHGDRTNISHTISSYQNTGDCLMFAKHPFEQVIRGVVNTIKPDAKISSEVFTMVQYYIEQWIVDILRGANFLALYSNRLKVVPNDIEMVLTLMEKKGSIPSFFR